MRCTGVGLNVNIKKKEEYKKYQNYLFGIGRGQVVLFSLLFGKKMTEFRLFQNRRLDIARIYDLPRDR